jgi:predicted nuclease of predicted toxin-antitoxin system
MRILLDECLPRRLKTVLIDHEVRTVPEMGWSGLKDREILSRARRQFDVFVTIDQGLDFLKSSLSSLAPLTVIILSAPSNRFEDLQPLMKEVRSILENLLPGQVVRIG